MRQFKTVYNTTVPAPCLPHTGFAGVWTPATHAGESILQLQADTCSVALHSRTAAAGCSSPCRSQCDTPQHEIQPDAMALITSDFDAMRSPSIKWR